MAEAIYKAEIAKRNLDWQIDSAATSSWEVGHSAHPGTKRLRQADLSSEGLISRQITEADFAKFDWIIGMDQSNVETLQALAPADTTAKIRSYLSVVLAKKPRKYQILIIQEISKRPINCYKKEFLLARGYFF